MLFAKLKYNTHNSLIIFVASRVGACEDGCTSLTVVHCLSPLGDTGDRNGCVMVDEAIQCAVVFRCSAITSRKYVDNSFFISSLTIK